MIDEIIQINGVYILKSEAVESKIIEASDEFFLDNNKKSWVKTIRPFDKSFDGSDRRNIIEYSDEKGKTLQGIEVVFFKKSIYCIEQFLDVVDPSICLHKDIEDFEGNNQHFFDWYCKSHEIIHGTSVLKALKKLHRGTKGGARKGAGRPAPNGAKTTMSIRIPQSHKDKAMKFAADNGISASQFIENLIEQYDS